MKVDMDDSDAARFNSVAVICNKCGLSTWWHKHSTLQGSSIAAIDDWELVQEKKNAGYSEP